MPEQRRKALEEGCAPKYSRMELWAGLDSVSIEHVKASLISWFALLFFMFFLIPRLPGGLL